MEHLADFRGLSALIGGLFALIVIGIVVARFLRRRGPRTPEASELPPDLPSAGGDPGFLDSSHILNRTVSSVKGRAASPEAQVPGRGGEGSGNGSGRGGAK